MYSQSSLCLPESPQNSYQWFFFTSLRLRNTIANWRIRQAYSSPKTLILSSRIEKLLKKVRPWIFLQILMHNNFRQRNGIESEFFTQALCWEYYSNIRNEVVANFNTSHQRPWFWVQKLKKKVRVWRFFQILMHNNFRPKKSISMKLFIEALCWEYYKQIKEFSCHAVHQIP